jgi:iron complex transport system substrate-binding protein
VVLFEPSQVACTHTYEHRPSEEGWFVRRRGSGDPLREPEAAVRSTRTTIVAVACALGLLAAACGDDGDDPVVESGERPETTTTAAPGDETSFPVTISADNGEITITEQPEAIVSLSPTGTEMLFAIDAGDQVVAVDEYSTYPDDAPVTDLSGYRPNVEAIAGYEPDLVVLSEDREDVVAGLGALDIPVVVLGSAATLDDTYTQIETLGAATGHVGDAAEVVGQMQTDIDQIVAEAPDVDGGLTYYHELTEDLYSITSDTFIGEVYGLLGLSSIADEADGASESGYPQLSPEFVVAADPDVIFLADAGAGGVTPADVAARPGWSEMSAVANERIIVVDEDLASRWGPRIVDFLDAVADELPTDVTSG